MRVPPRCPPPQLLSSGLSAEESFRWTSKYMKSNDKLREVRARAGLLHSPCMLQHAYAPCQAVELLPLACNCLPTFSSA